MAILKNTTIEGFLEIKGKDENGKALILPEGSTIFVGDKEFQGGGSGGEGVDTNNPVFTGSVSMGRVESSEIGENSVALGENLNVLSKTSAGFGVDNIVGQKGYYIMAIDYNEKCMWLDANESGVYFVMDRKTIIPVEAKYNDDATWIYLGNGEWYSENYYVTIPPNSKDNARVNLNKPSFVSGYEVGDEFNIIVPNNHYVLCGKITAIDGNKISYEIIPNHYANEDFNKEHVFLTEEELKARWASLGLTWTTLRDAIGADDYTFSVPRKSTVGSVVITRAGFASGVENIAAGGFSRADGAENLAAGNFAYVEGQKNIAGYSAHAEGYMTEARGKQSHAENNRAKAYGHNSHAEGYDTKTYGEGSHAEGKGSVTGAEGENMGFTAHAEGRSTLAYGDYSHSEGKNTKANGNSSHAEGDTTTASGKNSHAEGNTTKAEGVNSHSEGETTHAIGQASHVEGSETYTKGAYAHAEGKHTIANGESSHTEGHDTNTEGNAAHAEGYNTKAYGNYSHAEGENTAAQGESSHVEGINNTVYVKYGHAEGRNNIVGDADKNEGLAAHVEGRECKAIGDFSHAEGYQTESYGRGSHAEGRGTVSNGAYTHVQGKFNIIDESMQDKFGGQGAYAHIVGNGNSPDNRSNAHTLDWKGNAWYAGQVECSAIKLGNYLLSIDSDGNLQITYTE